jgi:hypothetical protein
MGMKSRQPLDQPGHWPPGLVRRCVGASVRRWFGGSVVRWFSKVRRSASPNRHESPHPAERVLRHRDRGSLVRRAVPNGPPPLQPGAKRPGRHHAFPKNPGQQDRPAIGRAGVPKDPFQRRFHSSACFLFPATSAPPRFFPQSPNFPSSLIPQFQLGTLPFPAKVPSTRQESSPIAELRTAGARGENPPNLKRIAPP